MIKIVKIKINLDTGEEIIDIIGLLRNYPTSVLLLALA